MQTYPRGDLEVDPNSDAVYSKAHHRENVLDAAGGNPDAHGIVVDTVAAQLYCAFCGDDGTVAGQIADVTDAQGQPAEIALCHNCAEAFQAGYSEGRRDALSQSQGQNQKGAT